MSELPMSSFYFWEVIRPSLFVYSLPSQFKPMRVLPSHGQGPMVGAATLTAGQGITFTQSPSPCFWSERLVVAVFGCIVDNT